ncbi:MAG TPA: methyltransferase domain-containing protein [Stellaceae bacterium]|nr:methyltransferase domain-containing protein [Stellaceae bacterium]
MTLALRAGYLLYLAARDKRVPTLARVVAAVCAAYVISPINLIPDEIPVVGELDDAVVVVLGIVVTRRLVPAPLLEELRAKAAERFPETQGVPALGWTQFKRPPKRSLAFGVDPHRRERYSLREARYDALAEDVSEWAAIAAQAGETLSVLDAGCGSGLFLRHLEAKPHFDKLVISATDLLYRDTYRRGLYQDFFLGDLMDGYPEIPSNAYDVVVCEQVLEHVADLNRALSTLARIVKPGGRLIIGVPVFLPPLHLARMYVVPRLDRLLGRRHERGHTRAFSLRSFLEHVAARRDLHVPSVRGFRVISGGILRPLENYRWWWKFNRWLGARIPAACIEIQAIVQKSPAASSTS